MTKGKSLIKNKTPEDIEFEKKNNDLNHLEEELTQRELELATLLVELQQFHQRYVRIVGVKLAELDEVEAQIAELLASLEPKNEEARENAFRTRAHAKGSAESVDSTIAEEPTEPFKPSEELKRIYREVAKKIHPDLTLNDKTREHRHKLMQEANQAYAEGNIERLVSILNEWESSPNAVEGEGIGAELVRIIRKISQIQIRITAIENEIEELKATELYELKLKVEEAENDERDLLGDMITDVEKKLSNARKRLKALKKKGNVKA